MILKIAYNDASISLVQNLKFIIKEFPMINLEIYQEEIFKERKKAFKLKGAFSARQTPFAVLYNNEKVPVIVFYSESNDCNFENIISKLKEFIAYEYKGNSNS